MSAAVRFTEDGDGFDTQLAAGPDNTKGDLASVRDQNSLKHGVLNSKRWALTMGRDE
jgi:hypothetical protein